MQGHEAVLATLGTANGQHRGVQVDVWKLEVERLAESQARDAQQSEQTVEHPRSECVARVTAGHGQRRAQQATDLFVRIQIGTCPPGSERQQARRRNLRARICRAAVAGEPANEAQSLRPMGRRGISGLLRPGESQLRSDVERAALAHEGGEVEQALAGLPELETQIAPHRQIVLDGLTQGVHCAPPGHGSASLRSAWISTFV